MSAEDTIGDLIARKRAAGYDAEFEALLARPWRCPHCAAETTITGVLIPVGTSDAPICPACRRPGVEPIYPQEPQLKLIGGGAR